MGRTPLTRRLISLAAGATLTAALSACGTDAVPQNADLIAGKQAFVKACSSCHVLSRANTKGTVGPSLDDAFRQSLSDGLGRDTIRGVVLSADRAPRPPAEGFARVHAGEPRRRQARL